jgi:RecA/RadA recombinase
LAFAAARTETAILVLNQVRSRAGASEAETTAGGPALKLHAAVRISLEHSNRANCVRFRILKSKMGDAFREGELRLDGGHQCSNTL